MDVVPTTLTSELESVFTSRDGADVTLCCGEERLAAHSFVLCLRSPVLRALLRGPLASDLSAVPVPSFVQADVMKRVLQFIYTDALEPSSPEEAQHLLAAGDHFGLTRLVSICAAHLASSLTVENASFALTLASQHGADGLRDATLRFVAKNAAAVVGTPGWAHLKAACPELVEAVMLTAATGAPPPGKGKRARET